MTQASKDPVKPRYEWGHTIPSDQLCEVQQQMRSTLRALNGTDQDGALIYVASSLVLVDPELPNGSELWLAADIRHQPVKYLAMSWDGVQAAADLAQKFELALASYVKAKEVREYAALKEAEKAWRLLWQRVYTNAGSAVFDDVQTAATYVVFNS